jgi:hypothetical protein
MGKVTHERRILRTLFEKSYQEKKRPHEQIPCAPLLTNGSHQRPNPKAYKQTSDKHTYAHTPNKNKCSAGRGKACTDESIARHKTIPMR